jgi:peptide/nickel transport system substrate-binding protein
LADTRDTRLETSLLPAFWANPGTSTQPPFDVARAQQLLADAGWRDTDGDGILEQNGKPLSVTLWAQSDDPSAEETAQRVRAQLQAVGAQVVLKLADRTLFLTRVFLQEYDTALAHFNIPLDPDQNYFWTTAENEPGYGLNVTGYQNATVENALNAGNAVAQCEPNARKKAYAPVWQQLATDVPMVFLFAPQQALAAQPHVQGITPGSFGGAFWNLEVWKVAP